MANAPTRRSILLGAACSLIIPTGCGVSGGTPASGSQAVLPPDYKAREKEIADGFKATMKRKKRPARPGPR
ncbi:hypothetical protein P12x_005707 [Tundrisphaera lichenicola]|uniref:hypothetical protein n=1 Tax=Tundrisphaera lichenicola TaxID=2029860 RepID=UPI003EBDD25D